MLVTIRVEIDEETFVSTDERKAHFMETCMLEHVLEEGNVNWAIILREHTNGVATPWLEPDETTRMDTWG